MKRTVLLFTAAALVSLPALTDAAPGNKQKRKNARPAAAVPEKPAAPPQPAAVKPDSAHPWHQWIAADGQQVEAKFLALENGILTVETRDARSLRFPLARLNAADQTFARACRELQPRPPMAQDIIVRAATRLDEAVAAGLKKAGVAPNAKATDAQFLRRLYLDVTGRIPSEAEARRFLSDARPDKRAHLINELLNSPGYTMHLFNWFADMLRVKDDYGKGAKAWLYEDWLKDQIAMNRPWDAMVRDMLTADGKLNANGAAGFLLRDAQMPLDGVSNLLTTFLGADVSCAQCHDHPFAEWTQKDFYGMAAFFGATDGFHEDTFRKIRRLAKAKAVAQLGKGAVNQILGSNPYDLVDLPKNKLTYPSDYKYDNAKPGEKVEPELIKWDGVSGQNPAYTIAGGNPPELREAFAQWMTHPDNPRFATAIANRMWKKVFGIAVQEPVSDLDDPAGASNPELLQHITTYMRQAKFDLREFQRILFNTAAYQRQASATPDDLKKYAFPGPVLRRMTAEQAWDSILTLAAGTGIDHFLLRRGDDLRKTAIPDSQLNVEGIKQVMASAEGLRPMAGGGGKKKKGGKVNPRVLEAAYEGGTPRMAAGLVLARSSELPQPAPETHFLRLFGQSDRLVADTNTVDGSVPQMLTLMNGPVQEMVTSDSAVLAEAAKARAAKDTIAALYLAFLARQPSSEEMDRAQASLSDGLAVSDLAWVLLNSREFLFVQ